MTYRKSLALSLPVVIPLTFLSFSCGKVSNPNSQGRGALVRYESCADLEADLKQMLIAEAEARLEQWEKGGGPRRMGAEEGDAKGASPASEGTREEGKDYSGTNNQENGVDEADFVKTDGYHVYAINGNRLHIFGVPEFGDLVPESVMQIEGWPREMLINRNAQKAVVFSQINPYDLPKEHPLYARLARRSDEYRSGDYWFRTQDITKLTVLDISDRKKPALSREIYLEGWYQTARMVDASVRLGAYSWIFIPAVEWYYYEDGSGARQLTLEERKAIARQRIMALDLSDIVPQVYERLPSRSFAALAFTGDECRSFNRPEGSHARGIASILSLDLLSDQFRFDADHVLANWPTFYASKNWLFVAEPAHDWWWYWWNEEQKDQTNIHAFDIRAAGETTYLGSGRVDGLLHNQFSLGEYQDYLRVATTTNMWGRWWVEDAPQPENQVSVLALEDGRLNVIGQAGGIAKGERIFSARFVGERGYMVTFRNTDPLFTLDLTNPYQPRVAGELKVPGFSTYLHPISDERLLSIGVGGDDTRANWRTQISMFDVSDFTSPKLYDVEELVSENSWGWSEAQYEHKAFQYWAPKKLLAIPMSGGSSVASEDGDGYYWTYSSRLELITVDPEKGLERYGSIDHSDLFNSDPNRYWYYTDVRRSIFMGDFVYAISDRGITVHRTEGLAKVTDQALPGYRPEDQYYWW
ncbi:MAG: beta-propeller domain-containing protein [Deltaproteobacteria bacterium]|nr:beta-propeller domain-containing protein [Deltaproteobacteria bacterium]